MASSFLTTGKKIVAIGRNYAAHAKELKNAPTTSYLVAPSPIEIPRGVEAHYEVELGVVVGGTPGRPIRDIPAAEAMSHVAGYTLSIDMTARNVQDKVKKAGLPWSTAKGFDTFTPTSGFIDRANVPDPSDLRLWLKVNGQTKQHGTTADMIFDIPTLIQHVSGIMSLEAGDLILTGTPQGVGQVVDGDLIEAGLETPDGKSLEQIKFEVKNRVGGYRFKL
ncbi:uncharacterized protein PFL1_04896 [Pseudozyma flocculosa PF-1]|uniref:Fumarylacetoacetase-like C-terminal domain-containing protein n=1 Tax=Pseudozyma flocculosa PF-1 TaxID=1277687 RepID=A0A061H5M7_9BASI|nr:uncharacterized protein PFL1_04896 [Pseudozyma flocculosa PF-1]EPQ27759.1 hypothetical protein PFL1_04896 [Pseudozyma flocculosa PF-1]